MADDIWGDDVLERKAEARLLIDFLVRRNAERQADGEGGSYVLNINAPWGRGKSFFLSKLQAQLQAEGHVAAYVNAWRDDAVGEPMVAVMASLEEALKPFLGKQKVGKFFASALASGSDLVVASLKGGASQIGKKIVGAAFEDMAESIGDAAIVSSSDAKEAGEAIGSDIGEQIAVLADAALDKKLSAYRKRQRSVETFKIQMGRLVKQLDLNTKSRAPMFVLVDELDRCRPSYAISMLEEIKHLFDIDQVIFIIATDTAELSHSVNAIYGQGFDSAAYLHRFFHRRYIFAEPKLHPFVGQLFHRYSIKTDLLVTPPHTDHVQFFVGAMEHFDLSLRDAEQCFDMLRSFVTVWRHNTPIQLLYLLPMIIAHLKGALGNRKYPFEFMKMAREMQPPRPWQVYFDHRKTDRGIIPNWMSVLEVVNLMNDLSVSPLREIYDTDSRAADRRWLAEQFREELTKLHGRIDHERPPYSIIRQYADAVRMIGRLSDLDPTP